MIIFSKIFILLTTGLFLALFMLIVEHPRKKRIGWIIFGAWSLLIWIDEMIAFMGLPILFSPALIFFGSTNHIA